MDYKLIIAYDGTQYHGWQVQPNGVSIQFLVEKALSTVIQKKIHLIGSGRTDAGVHALGQVAHFHVDESLNEWRILHSLNSLLPADIRILSLEPVLEGFHPRYDATSKIYRYHLYLEKVLSPFKRAYVWHIREKFDQKRLQESIPYFIGTHNFISFANESHKGVAAKDPIRTIYRIDILQEEGGIALEFEGDGFLYKMVRNIVGMLVECATAKRFPHEIPEVLQSKDRRKASMAAPPQGLFLVQVNYQKEHLLKT